MPINQQRPPEAYETLKQNPDALYLDVRTEAEFATLFEGAGFKLTRVVPTKGPLFVVEAEKV